ncbi:SIMPL domain-containing protein [Humisphaera borealis]|uniref:SIMPL domain-containing protein n=1 Tax=Humisphaera borealis TaxID=2807512 RepID=A0A7M2WRT2_9BACT|nr:SIMPL domain-containing protein [Humisphaera borealis]QOV88186.1 SIMPL domain-containing protein [Humisphaera borealis]
MSNTKFNIFLLVLFGAAMPAAVVLSTNLARSSFEKVKLRDQTITVKGYAERPISSDRAVFSAEIGAREKELTAAYTKLEADRAKVMAFLATKGFAGDQVQLGPVAIRTLYSRDAKGNPTNQIELHSVSQSVTIASATVKSIADAARDISTVIRDGVELSASPPQYSYTKLDDVKLQMIAEATGNARLRGEALVKNSNNRLGTLRSASQGVFQITPAFSTEISDSGVNDTSSIDKTIKATVTIEYAIE